MHVTPGKYADSRNGSPARRCNFPVSFTGTVLIGLLMHTGPTRASELQSALEAFNTGRFQVAEEHWQRCANAGVADCQYGLGVLYDRGYGRPEDSTKALHWYRRAALNGSRDAQVQLGFIYATGRKGIDQAPVKAFVWFSMAANNGAKNAPEYRDKVAQRLNTGQLDEAYRQLNELNIQYYLQESQD